MSRLNFDNSFKLDYLHDTRQLFVSPGSADNKANKETLAYPPPACFYSSFNLDEDSSGEESPEGLICNCKNSKCLKLYCHCFRTGRYCSPSCLCSDCKNLSDFEDERRAIMISIKSKNPLAFCPRLGALQTTGTHLSDEVEGQQGPAHYRGCHCKKSHCQKKYCECFQMGVQCTDQCKCSACLNGKRESTKKKEKTGLAHDESRRFNSDGLRKRLLLDPESSVSREPMTGSGKRPLKNNFLLKTTLAGGRSNLELHFSAPGKKDRRGRD